MYLQGLSDNRLDGGGKLLASTNTYRRKCKPAWRLSRRFNSQSWPRLLLRPFFISRAANTLVLPDLTWQASFEEKLTYYMWPIVVMCIFVAECSLGVISSRWENVPAHPVRGDVGFGD